MFLYLLSILKADVETFNPGKTIHMVDVDGKQLTLYKLDAGTARFQNTELIPDLNNAIFHFDLWDKIENESTKTANPNESATDDKNAKSSLKEKSNFVNKEDGDIFIDSNDAIEVNGISKDTENMKDSDKHEFLSRNIDESKKLNHNLQKIKENAEYKNEILKKLDDIDDQNSNSAIEPDDNLLSLEEDDSKNVNELKNSNLADRVPEPTPDAPKKETATEIQPKKEIEIENENLKKSKYFRIGQGEKYLYVKKKDGSVLFGDFKKEDNFKWLLTLNDNNLSLQQGNLYMARGSSKNKTGYYVKAFKKTKDKDKKIFELKLDNFISKDIVEPEANQSNTDKV